MSENTLTTVVTSEPGGAGFTSFLVPGRVSTGKQKDNAFQVLASVISGFFKGFAQIFRDKKKLVMVGIMLILWVLPLILEYFASMPTFMKQLNFFTFAMGGLTGGLLSMVGGMVGRGMVACFFSSLFLPLFHRQLPLFGLSGGIKIFFENLWIKNLSSLGNILFGMGAGLVFFNFLTGNFSFQNSIIGLYGTLLLLRSLRDDKAFITRFLRGFSRKENRKNKVIAPLVTGLSLGLLAAIPLSLLDMSSLGYFSGGTLAVVGLFFFVFFKTPRKGGVA